MAQSMAERVAALPEAERAAFFAGLSPRELESLPWCWDFWARGDQLPPEGPWRTFLLLGGRGSGKTRSAAEWVRREVESGRRARLAVIGPTSDSVRRVMVEGPSGLLAVAPPWNRPTYEPSIRRITWESGAVCNLYSAEEPDRLRGENSDGAWADEICSWANSEETWNMLQMGLRLPGPRGDAPQVLVTTTPKNIPVLRSILESPTTVISRSRTADNQANLDASTLAFLTEKYGGTTLGRQELDAELLADSDEALWSRSLLNQTRVAVAPELRRIVVGLDPAGSSNRNADETGLIVAGRGHDGHAYILADHSGRYTPSEWARKAVQAYRTFKADRILAESNFGGAMVESVIRTEWPLAPLKLLHASKGKQARAEPCSALWEQGKAHIVGNLPGLEDQLTSWAPLTSTHSPDRLDAMVWCLSELMLGHAQPARRINLDIFTR